MNILIVDDDADLAWTVADVLEFDGHKVRLAPNGIEGLRAMSEELPDVLLLDIEMPLLDGPSMAYRLLIEDAGREQVPIVVSSGHSGVELIAARIGTPYVLRKPCTLEAMRAMLERAGRERLAPRPVRSPPPQVHR